MQLAHGVVGQVDEGVGFHFVDSILPGERLQFCLQGFQADAGVWQHIQDWRAAAHEFAGSRPADDGHACQGGADPGDGAGHRAVLALHNERLPQSDVILLGHARTDQYAAGGLHLGQSAFPISFCEAEQGNAAAPEHLRVHHE